MKHKLDLYGDRLISMMLDAMVSVQRRQDFEDEYPEARIAIMFSMGALQAILRAAHGDRTIRERNAALEMVQEGMIGRGTPDNIPEWWVASDTCCGRPWEDHLVVSEPEYEWDESLVLCPFKRGYWTMAHIVLSSDRVREIARDAARHHAPVWKGNA